MSNKNDDPLHFVKFMTISFGLAILSVPIGLGLGQLIKYFMGS